MKKGGGPKKSRKKASVWMPRKRLDGQLKSRNEEASVAKLRKDVVRMSREHRENHERARDDVRIAVEGVDQKLQEEITRVAEDATVEGKRHVTNLRFRLQSVVATTTDTLQQNLAEQDRKRDRVRVSLQRAVEAYTGYHRTGTEALNRKFTDMVGAFAAEHNGQQQKTHTTL